MHGLLPLSFSLVLLTVTIFFRIAQRFETIRLQRLFATVHHRLDRQENLFRRNALWLCLIVLATAILVSPADHHLWTWGHLANLVLTIGLILYWIFQPVTVKIPHPLDN